MAIGVGAAALEGAINGTIEVIVGDSTVQEAIIDGVISVGISAFSGAEPSDFAKGSVFDEAVEAFGDVAKKGAHPDAKKTAQKLFRKKKSKQ